MSRAAATEPAREESPGPAATPPSRPFGPNPTLHSRAAARAEFKKALDRYVGIPALWMLHGLGLLAAPFLKRRLVGEVRRVVLAKLWGVGNLAMILPYARAVRRRYPDAEIVFLSLERNRPLLDGHPCIDTVWTVRENGVLGPLGSLLALVGRMRRRRVDLFLDFEQFLRATGLIARLGGVRQAIGFDTPGQHRARLHQARVPFDPDRHMQEVFGDVVRAAGVEIEGLSALEVPRSPAVADGVRRLLDELGPRRLLLHPGSGDNFPGRRWPLDRFAELGVALARERGAAIVLSGTAAESPLVEPLRRHLDEHGVRTLDLCGRLDLQEWIETLGAVDLVVSNDTGPAHLAGAVDTPVVALYGPNTPDLYGPRGARSKAIYHRLPCSPCLTNLNAKSSSCRLPSCILSISVDEVLEACRTPPIAFENSR